MSTLQGQTIVILGGSAGIGYSVALSSLHSLASNVIIASSSPSRVDSAVHRLNAEKGPNAPGVVRGEAFDGRDLGALKRFFEAVGEIDHLVITSGDTDVIGADVKTADLEQYKSLFDLRFWGSLQAARSANIKQNGSITFTIGNSHSKPPKGWSLAAGVLGAVDGLTRGLAVDLAPVRVNCISPGAVDTELWEALFPKEKIPEVLKTAAEKSLVKHVATPAEIAETYLFVMKCGFITGETIKVNGGSNLV